MEPLNPDLDLCATLQPRSKAFLDRLYTVFSGESVDCKKETLIDIIADRHEDQLRDFLDDYEKLSERNVNRRYAEEYLHESLGVDRETLDVKNRYELLLVLYEEDLVEKLDSLIIRSELFAVKNERKHHLDEGIELENLERKIELENLKGKDFSLKRSSRLKNGDQPPEHIDILETLNIFGVQADYMQQFRQYLEEEGIEPEYWKRDLEVRVKNELVDEGLKVPRVDDDRDFK